jgi:uncharacterized protein
VRGDVQLIPIGDSILYLRPIYVSTTEGATFPRFKYVAVTYGESSVLALSVPDALNTLFGAGSGTSPPTGPKPPTTVVTPGAQTVTELLADAQSKFNAATKALKNGDLATYAKDVAAAQKDVNSALAVINAAGGSTSPTTTPSSGSTTTTAPGSTTTAPTATTTSTTTPPA